MYTQKSIKNVNELLQNGYINIQKDCMEYELQKEIANLILHQDQEIYQNEVNYYYEDYMEWISDEFSGIFNECHCYRHYDDYKIGSVDVYNIPNFVAAIETSQLNFCSLSDDFMKKTEKLYELYIKYEESYLNDDDAYDEMIDILDDLIDTLNDLTSNCRFDFDDYVDIAIDNLLENDTILNYFVNFETKDVYKPSQIDFSNSNTNSNYTDFLDTDTILYYANTMQEA